MILREGSDIEFVLWQKKQDLVIVG
jgi:hypothetical protein